MDETYRKIVNNDVFQQMKDNFIEVSNYIKNNISCKLMGYFAESRINSNERDAMKSTRVSIALYDVLA